MASQEQNLINKTNVVYASVLVAIGVLPGCGGGGSSDPAVTSVTSFPLQAAYKALVAAGYSANYTVSGTCTGTANTTTATPVTGTFEGSAALAVTSTLTASFTNCTPASLALPGQNFYDSNYNLLGTVTSNAYAKFVTPMAPIPALVKAGDTGLLGSETVYTDSTKAVSAGKVDLSYVVATDTATTAMVTLILTSYNASSQPLLTQQVKYRITGDGMLTIVSNDLQFSTTSTTHLVLTKV
jgi:hypothetical protein